jgi:hypothetical protein
MFFTVAGRRPSIQRERNSDAGIRYSSLVQQTYAWFRWNINEVRLAQWQANDKCGSIGEMSSTILPTRIQSNHFNHSKATHETSVEYLCPTPTREVQRRRRSDFVRDTPHQASRAEPERNYWKKNMTVLQPCSAISHP